jgi:prepilin-type N-terminal cleavage/methylation domain-containing protein
MNMEDDFSDIRPCRHAGFTMIELLVVIGIIAVLVSILLPTIFAVKRKAEIARTKSDLDTISIALEEYKKVFFDYPRQADPNKGSAASTPRDRLLYQYLIGPNGQGVRVAGTSSSNTQGGKKWGPYLPPDKFKYGSYTSRNGVDLHDRILDRYGQEIMYYPRYNNYDKRPGLPGGTALTDGYLLGKVAASPPPASSPQSDVPKIRAMFNKYDGLVAQSTDTEPPAQPQAAINEHIVHTLYMLGDGDDAVGGTPVNNQIIPPESLTFKGPYMLISAGPDKKWGRDTTDNVNYNYNKHSDADDVYNFGR